MFGQILLLVADRIDCTIYDSPQSKDKEFQQQHNQADRHSYKEVFVLRFVDEAELTDGVRY